MMSENNKIVEEGIKKIEEGNFVKRQLALSVYFNRFLSNRSVFDSFCFKRYPVSAFLLAIISRVFNQLLLVKLFVL